MYVVQSPYPSTWIPTGLSAFRTRYLTGIAEIALRFRPPGYW